MNLANLQLFAHKKGGGSTSNGRDSQAKRLGAKAALQKLKALYALNAKVAIKNKFLFTQLRNKN